MVDTARLAEHKDSVLWDAVIPELPNHTKGKVRETYDLGDGRIILVTTDRLSAFDRILTAVPFKGRSRSSSATISPAPPGPRSLPCTNRGSGRSTAIASPTGCATIRS
jgi:hypothetical protein